MINIIVCMSQPTRVIGKDGGIPWHLPPDFKWFRQLTLDQTIIMGRKTWDSLTIKPLPSRDNVIISKTLSNDNASIDGAELFSSLGEALAAYYDSKELWIIGGQQIYQEALDTNIVDRMFITYIDQPIDGDTFFPEINQKDWVHRLLDQGKHNDLDYSFWMYERTQ